MLIKCSECQRDVSDSASACPGCGHPLTISSTTPAGMSPNSESSLVGSFMLGSFGKILRWVGLLVIAISVVGLVLHGPTAPVFLIIGVAMIVGGSYAKYVSRQSVRVPTGRQRSRRK